MLERGDINACKTPKEERKPYKSPQLVIYGNVRDITKGPNTSPADASSTGGLFGAGGTS